jgi:hypothetical protein
VFHLSSALPSPRDFQVYQAGQLLIIVKRKVQCIARSLLFPSSSASLASLPHSAFFVCVFDVFFSNCIGKSQKNGCEQTVLLLPLMLPVTWRVHHHHQQQ